MSEPVLINDPVIFKDLWCDPECPHLDTDNESLDANCKKDGKEIMWYDWHLAHCVEDDPCKS